MTEIFMCQKWLNWSVGKRNDSDWHDKKDSVDAENDYNGPLQHVYIIMNICAW